MLGFRITKMSNRYEVTEVTTMALCEHRTTLQCRAQLLLLLLEVLLIAREGTGDRSSGRVEFCEISVDVT